MMSYQNRTETQKDNLLNYKLMSSHVLGWIFGLENTASVRVRHKQLCNMLTNTAGQTSHNKYNPRSEKYGRIPFSEVENL